ncbi:acyl carrier protein [Thioalkalivibrio sp. XN8]|uniref:acyl carrier protein n=1 Tax=Thioalkalivibrio sp. XN8 TaxID=2712863 RepID=UPI0013EE308A|nr:acyl carrier protein [Thioalkalivibrio sp. XN8]NGP53682.1 acyl carrier protein [Thioalkalivibrio sp. XN8]
MSTEVKDQIKQYILETYLFTSDTSALGDDESFLDRGIIDSTGVLELIFFLEEQFGVKIADEELLPENLDSVSRLTAFVERKRAAA